MTTPLILGPRQFTNNFIQGPLAGISCAPFRRLTWQYSQPAFSCTEMISCKTLIHQSRDSQQRFVYKSPLEGPVCFQLAASDPQEVALATRIVTDLGADLIDLNCGCPVNKIRRKGAGSGLLQQPKRLYEMIRAMKHHTHVPVSVKIRVEGGSNEVFNADIAHAIQEAGADFVIVHGRHWTEHYETPCRHEQIRFFVEQMNIPVIGNGDIACLASLQRMLATGCAGVMIGRAGVGQPWLIRQLQAQLLGQAFTVPTPADIGSMFIDHIQDLSQLLHSDKWAILQARKMAKYYARPIDLRAAFCEALNDCQDFDHFKRLCQEYFVNSAKTKKLTH